MYVVRLQDPESGRWDDYKSFNTLEEAKFCQNTFKGYAHIVKKEEIEVGWYY